MSVLPVPMSVLPVWTSVLPVHASVLPVRTSVLISLEDMECLVSDSVLKSYSK